MGSPTAPSSTVGMSRCLCQTPKVNSPAKGTRATTKIWAVVRQSFRGCAVWYHFEQPFVTTKPARVSGPVLFKHHVDTLQCQSSGVSASACDSLRSHHERVAKLHEEQHGHNLWSALHDPTSGNAEIVTVTVLLLPIESLSRHKNHRSSAA